MIPALDPGENRGRRNEGCAAHRAAEGFGREGCPGRAQGPGTWEKRSWKQLVLPCFTPENIDETWGNHRTSPTYPWKNGGLLWFKHVRFGATLTLRRVWLQVDMKIKLLLINMLFVGGGEFWPLMEIKLMLLPQSTYCSERVANINAMMTTMWWWW